MVETTDTTKKNCCQAASTASGVRPTVSSPRTTPVAAGRFLRTSSGSHTITARCRYWKRQFIDGGSSGLEGRSLRSIERVRELEAEIAELKAALGEVYMEMRGRRRVADYRAVPSRSSSRSVSTQASPSRASAASLTSLAALMRDD